MPEDHREAQLPVECEESYQLLLLERIQPWRLASLGVGRWSPVTAPLSTVADKKKGLFDRFTILYPNLMPKCPKSPPKFKTNQRNPSILSFSVATIWQTLRIH
ncbi:hypothetical protein ERO13_D06G130650v2 [Gossypium hirsutum]|nr:hypothetical protein ERO13_D06G130650v2 [Gossypium hirsutum]